MAFDLDLDGWPGDRPLSAVCRAVILHAGKSPRVFHFHSLPLKNFVGSVLNTIQLKKTRSHL